MPAISGLITLQIISIAIPIFVVSWSWFSNVLTLRPGVDGPLPQGREQRIFPKRLWDVATQTRIRDFTGHADGVRAIAFSMDGRLLATGGKDKSIRVWEVSTGQLLKRLGLSDVIQRAAFSADGQRLVTGGMNGAVKLWDVTMQQELMTLIGHADAVNSVTFSPDGKSLATGGNDGVVRIWRDAPVTKNQGRPYNGL